MDTYRISYRIERYIGPDEKGSYEQIYPSHMTKEEIRKIESNRNMYRLEHNYDSLAISVEKI